MVPAYDRHFRGEHKRSVGKTHEHHHPAHAGRRDKVARTASRVGQDVSAYVHSLIEKDISCVDEALAPFSAQVEESRMSDDELHALFEEARAEVWQEKQSSPSRPIVILAVFNRMVLNHVTLFGEGEPPGEPSRIQLGESLALPRSRKAIEGPPR